MAGTNSKIFMRAEGAQNFFAFCVVFLLFLHSKLKNKAEMAPKAPKIFEDFEKSVHFRLKYV